MSVRALEFYSGIGGLHLALKRSKVPGIVIKAFDWDQNAARVYDANHGPSLTAKIDISDLTASFLAPYRANLWILSPACQPYTVLNPDAKGILDPRARSFLHLVQDVLPELVSMDAHPTHFLVENVGGFEGSPTRRVLLSQLHTLDPRMNPIADSELVDVNITDIQHYLDNEDGSSLYLGAHAVSDRVLEKWGRLFDIAIPSSKRTCCFTRGYTHLVERSGSIIQMNPELNASQQDAVSILHPLRLRYFTPSELLRIFHFNLPSSPFFWPESISTKTKYRLIGNSVNVHVVTELINFLYEDRL
ncbi:S-adenosyl-L-methionine-dependent methyltransferase [Lentinula novae-zelandiae]|nr:S-adenosyl-L-methionine-dependent methyltransferase [Lentinula novae-zelandiae]